MKTNLDLEARETFIQFYPGEKLLRIREYGLSSLLTDDTEINTQAALLEKLVTNTEYCDTRFNIEGYKTAQEVLYATGNSQDNEMAAHIECLLVTNTGMTESMITVFSTILDREVNVAVTKEEISMIFNSQNLDVADNNSLGFLVNGDNFMLKWRNGERFYEAVFINKSKPVERFQAIFPYISQFPVESPSMDQEKIDKLRISLQ